jgi:hypothetical protein
MSSPANQLLDLRPGCLPEQLVAMVCARFPLSMAVYAFGRQVQGSAHDNTVAPLCDGRQWRVSYGLIATFSTPSRWLANSS